MGACVLRVEYRQQTLEVRLLHFGQEDMPHTVEDVRRQQADEVFRVALEEVPGAPCIRMSRPARGEVSINCAHRRKGRRIKKKKK